MKRTLFVKKNRFWWKFFSEKFFFGSFYSKKRQNLQLCFLSKTNNSFKKRKKNSLPIKIFEKNQILKPVFNNESDSNQVFQNGTIFWWTLHNPSIFVSDILQRVRFWNILLPHIRFWTEILTSQPTFTWNWFRNIKLSWTICFQTIFFLCQFTLLKCRIWRFPTFLESLLLRAMFLGKKHSLNRKLWEKSDFESIFSQRPRLFNKTKLFVSKFELSST